MTPVTPEPVASIDITGLTTTVRALVSAIATTRDLASLTPQILGSVIQAIQPDVACYYVPTPGGEEVVATEVYPEELWTQPETSTRFRRRGIRSFAIGRAIETRTPILIPDVRAAELKHEVEPFSENIGSEIVVPIFLNDAPIGVIAAGRVVGRDFTASDLSLCAMFGELLGVADRIIREKGNRDVRLHFLRELSSLATDDEDGVFDRALESVAEFLPTKFISLWLYNPVDETLVIRAFHPPFILTSRVTYDSLGSKVLPLDECLSGMTVRQKRLGVFERIQENPRNANAMFARAHGLEWFVSFPILGERQEVVGVVNVYPLVERSEIQEDDLEVTGVLISQLAATATIAMLKRENLFRTKYRRLCRRMDLTRECGAAWDKVAEAIAIDLKCEACSVFGFDAQASELVLKGTTGLREEKPCNEVRYRVGEGLTGFAFQKGGPVVYYRDTPDGAPHISKFRERLSSAERSRSILLLAISDDRGATIGVIRCINKQESPAEYCGRFTQHDVLFLQAIGEIVAEFVV